MTFWREGRGPLVKIRTAWHGMFYAFHNDFSVRYKIIVSLIVVLFSVYFSRWVDVIIILLATSNVLTAEFQNTAIEELCDFVEERHNERIKIIKDVGAASTGTAIIIWFGVILYQYYDLAKRFIFWLFPN
jgi:diacylglycerol kinase (ATP)